MESQIAVIGGGAAGTAAGHKLHELGHKVTIFEREDKLGGRICSQTLGDQSFELGATFITSGLYPNTFDFLKSTGLNTDLDRFKMRAEVVRDGEPHKASALLGNKWLSLGAKLKMLGYAVQLLAGSKGANIEDLSSAAPIDIQSISEDLQSPKGKELLEYMVQPVLDSYFYWEPEQVSHAMLAVLAKKAIHVGKMYALKHGLQQIPQDAAKNCTVLLGSHVKAVNQSNQQYTVTVNNKNLVFDGVVCATTATVATEVVKSLTAEQAAFLKNVRYSGTVVVARAARAEPNDKHHEVAYPRAENYPFTAVTTQTITSITEREKVVKVFASGRNSAALLSKSDEELKQILTLPAASQTESEQTFIKKWPEALPIFDVGYFKRLKTFVQSEANNNNPLVFAGDYLGGPYIEGAITSGLRAATELNQRLRDRG